MDKNFNLQRFVISVVLVGIMLVVGIYITSEIGVVSMDPNTAGTYVNVTMLRPTTGGITLGASSLRDGSCGTITAIYNGTGGVAIGLGNITQTGCVVVNATDVSSYGASWLVSYPYTYTAATSASNASDNVTTALATGTSWISILVVVGFATIILTMLTSGLGSAARETEATPYY